MVCACAHKTCHAYCASAFVLRSQKIYCKDCFSYFHLYVKSERIFSSEYIGGIIRLMVIFVALLGFIYGIFEIDRYLKNQDYIKNKVAELQQEGGSISEINKLLSNENKTVYIDNSFVILPLIFVLLIIMAWCFYLRFVMAFMKRKRLVWVEVQDYNNSEYSISRNEAKQNLHLVGEVTQKLKSYNYLFDKYWYRQREFQYIDGIQQEQLFQFSNENADEDGENVIKKDVEVDGGEAQPEHHPFAGANEFVPSRIKTDNYFGQE